MSAPVKRSGMVLVECSIRTIGRLKYIHNVCNNYNRRHIAHDLIYNVALGLKDSTIPFLVGHIAILTKVY